MAAEEGEAFRVGASAFAGVDVADPRCTQRGAVGAPDLGAVDAVIGVEVKVAIERGEPVRAGAIGSVGVDVFYQRRA